MRIDEIAEAVAALSLPDARALITALKARLALEDPPPDWTRAAALYGAPPPPADPSPYLPHAVVLQAVGPNRLQLISALRVALSLSMADAKALVDAAPCLLRTVPDEFAALDLARALRAVGASVTLRPTSP